MNKKIFAVGTVFESDTMYVADREVYHIYPSDPLTERDCWWTYLVTGGGPLKAAFLIAPIVLNAVRVFWDEKKKKSSS